MTRNLSPLHGLYLTLVGLAGWTLVAVATFWPPSFFSRPQLSWDLAACIALAVTSRFLVFPIYRRVSVALDSVFHIAIRFVFGTMPAAWVILFVLTVDVALRMRSGTSPVGRNDAPPTHQLGYLLHKGGLPALVLTLLGALFGDAPLAMLPYADVALAVPLFAIIFLVVHYFMASVATWLEGISPRVVFREFFLRGVAAEITLVPLSLAMVLAYRHQGLEMTLLLGSTGLLFNGIFRRWAITSDRLADRVVELSVLNHVGRTISGSFDRETLLRSLATTTLELVGGGSRFLVGLVNDKESDIEYRYFDAHGSCYKTIVASREAGLSGWMMRKRKPLRLGDLNRDYVKYVPDQTYNDPNFHSWLGVPLQVQDAVVGVIGVQTEEREAYTSDHQRVLQIIADQVAVAIENSRLYQLATVDGLTGLFVRRYFDHRLIEEYDRAARYRNPVALGLFDLDHFKQLNDTYGHQVGDQVLRHAARVVRENMRSFDLACRYGGEEFVFLLPRTDLDEAEKVAERIRRDVEKVSFPYRDQQLRFTTSIGVASYPGLGISSPDHLLKRADLALYRAKADGRNRVVADRGDDEGTPQATG